MTKRQQRKLDEMISGMAVVVSDQDLDAYLPLDISVEIRSAWNMDRCGMQDRLVAWIGDKNPPQYKLDDDNGDFTAVAVAGKCA